MLKNILKIVLALSSVGLAIQSMFVLIASSDLIIVYDGKERLIPFEYSVAYMFASISLLVLANWAEKLRIYLVIAMIAVYFCVSGFYVKECFFDKSGRCLVNDSTTGKNY